MSKKVKKAEEKKEQPIPNKVIEVTLDNAPKLTVKFLQMIYARLGYMIKILEEIKEKK